MLYLYACFVVAAIVLFARFYPRLTLLEIICGSVPVGCCVGAVIGLAASCITRQINIYAHYLAFAFLIYVTTEHITPVLRNIPKLRALWRRECGDLFVLAPLLAVTAVGTWELFSTRYIPDVNGEFKAGGSVWADLPIHLQTANSFLKGRNRHISFFNFESPIAAGHKMTYPYLPDFHAAFLSVNGESFRITMGVVGWILSLSYTGLQYLFGKRLTNSRTAAVLGVILITFAGGYAAIDIFLKRGWHDQFNHDPLQDSTFERGTMYWFGFYPHVMLPQRGATFAYPLVLLIFTLVWSVTGKDGVSTGLRVTPAEEFKVLGTAGALSGLLVMIQAHGFISLAVMMGVLFALQTRKVFTDVYFVRRWASAGAIALVAAMPMLYMISSKVGGDGLGFFDPIPVFKSCGPGYPEGQGIVAHVRHFFWFWFKGLGPFVPLYMASCVAVVYSRRWKLAQWVLAASVVFVVANMMRFQPWDKDNIKLFNIWMMIVAPLVAELLLLPLDLLGASLSAAVTGKARPTVFQERERRARDAPSRAKVVGASAHREGSHEQEEHDGADSHPPFNEDDDPQHKRSKPRKTARHVSRQRGVDELSLSSYIPVPCGIVSQVVLGALVVTSIFTVVILCFSGFLGAWRELTMQHTLYGPLETELSIFVDSSTGPDDIWLSKDSHLIAPAYLGGRHLLIAYSGWMWSHGYDWYGLQQDREKILRECLSESNQDIYSLLKKHNVKWILAENLPKHAGPRPGEAERIDFLDGKLHRVFSDRQRYEVYEVR